ncbi:dihydrofolate reductase [Bacillus atrophaeus]|uniref:dihydrofolate reductase n=1 Tax=Bacillus atrophaeus TaxID=1452 RepID=UPI000B92C1F8|nr:dihydrofolate reductase [Bacillus atrophaeus]ASS71490.1 dihydrofolate reductase [Bacillus atrophaeus]MBJ7896610.1 dihydrofolate reductase [Bacillus atrophaeus]MED1018074.1 dihydrofolate reductase [Bacillus atrophaeus]MED1030958.1 dihydrofolate reductase [Bacillus atrophaeus]MED1120153.1 dihydrofolate reductase [Bacillus atrophaeus]
MISFIFAMDENRLIGKNNDLPWRLPNDLAYFKKVTTGHAIVMGRKTFESIGRPLPNRKNIVVTSADKAEFPGCTVVRTIEDVLTTVSDAEECFVIGGAQLYQALFPYADRLYMTKIHHTFDGDRFFPEFNEDEWKLISEEQGIKDEKNPYNYEFLVYEKKNSSEAGGL